MKLHLRFGMHSEIELIHGMAEFIDGLIIPAHILAYQAASTSVFICSISSHPYVIDPMTYMLQSIRGELLADSGDLRPSVSKYLDDVGPNLKAMIEDGDIDEAPTPSDLGNYKELCDGVVEFQRTKVASASGTSAALRYVKRYSSTLATSPRCIVPPYFQFRELGDEWYNLGVKCATYVKSKCTEEVAPVIHAPVGALADLRAVRKIRDDFADFGRLFLWLNNFDQSAVTPEEVQTARDAITVLAGNGKVEIEMLFGGFLLMSMRECGVEAISHGILYTQHKDGTSVPGGGGVPERYYIPRFFDFRSLSQTDLILHRHRELMCDCSTCKRVLAGNPDNIVKFADDPDLLRRHFFEVRKREQRRVEKSGLLELATDFRDAHAKYDSSIRKLPNPDAVFSPGPMRGLQYLKNWADGLA